MPYFMYFTKMQSFTIMKLVQRAKPDVLTIYAPINFTAPCLIFSGGFFNFCHYEGDWALELETFLGPVKSHQPLGDCVLETKKIESSRAQSPE